MAREEPLRATASLVTSWLLIEQEGAWGPDALAESDFPPRIARQLADLAGRFGVRVLLIRRRTRRGSRRVVYLAHSGGVGRNATIRAGRVEDPEEVLSLDLEGLARGRLPDFGNELDYPVYLVCTHGRHDICCADRGRPLFRTLAGRRPSRTWESSHLGGDRFAGNLLVLPRGDYFGRVDPEDAAALVASYEEGNLDLRHYRGRSVYPRMAQAAEHFLRSSMGLTGLNALELVEYRRTDRSHAETIFADRSGSSHRVNVEAWPAGDPVFLTCRAQSPARPTGYVPALVDGT